MRVCPECGKGTDAETCPVDGTPTLDDRLFKDKVDPLIGSVLVGRYRVLEVLGRGGMGKVYVAEQIAMRRQVALKVILAEQASESDGRFDLVRRFQREAQAASRLEHPNTVRVFDFGHTDDGVLFLAMELLKGFTLAQVVRSNVRLAPQRVVRIASQICKSLSEAHDAGIIHRDMKPDNIMIVPMAGEPDFLKVLDFGIAKIVNKDTDSSNITRTGTVMGTPTYMAPEQASGATVTAATDLYSLGIILYECLSGRPPFTGETPLSVLIKHMNEPVPPIVVKGFPPDVPQELVDLVMHLLAKNPEARPGTALEVLRRLECLDYSRMHEGSQVAVAEGFMPALVETTVSLDRTPGGTPRTSGVGGAISGNKSVSGGRRWLALALLLVAAGLAAALAWAFLGPAEVARESAVSPDAKPASISSQVPAVSGGTTAASDQVVAPAPAPAPVVVPVREDPGVVAAAPKPSVAGTLSQTATPAPVPAGARARPSVIAKPLLPKDPVLPACAKLKCPFTQDCLNQQGKRTSGKDHCILDF